MPRLHRRRSRDSDEIIPSQLYDSNQPATHDDRVLTHRNHFNGGDNEICSIGGWKEFQIAMSKRATEARKFFEDSEKNSYYNRGGKVRRTFISRGGFKHSWKEKLYVVPRVVVYGVDSICMVMSKEGLGGLGGSLSKLLFEFEGLVCAPGESRRVERNTKTNRIPFGVVTMNRGANKAEHEAKAIKFLQDEMNSASTFSLFKTVTTSICALQHLLNKKFKPDEIKVTVWKSEWVYNKDTLCVRELKARDERSVKDLLSVINKKPLNLDGLYS